MQRATLALSCFGAIAASVLVASVTPVVGEPSAIKLDDHGVEATASDMTLAALDPTVIDLKAPETERTIDRLVPNADSRIVLYAEEAIVGIASFYDDPQKTASGEQYDPNAFTAAAQLEIRDRFGGIRFGKKYQPAYGLGEYGGKKIIVRFNDVGPLRPGRKFDLSRAAMAYFDNSLDKGLLPDFRMTPLPLGRTYPEGPVTDLQLADLGIDDDAASAVCAVTEEPKPIVTGSIAQPKPAARKVARSAKSKARAALRVSAKTRAKLAPVASISAPKAIDQTQETASPWVNRVVVASPAAAEPPVQTGSGRVSDKRRPASKSKKRLRAALKVMAQAR